MSLKFLTDNDFFVDPKNHEVYTLLAKIFIGVIIFLLLNLKKVLNLI